MRNFIRHLTCTACAAIIAIPRRANGDQPQYFVRRRQTDCRCRDRRLRGARWGRSRSISSTGSGNTVVSYRADGSRPHIYEVAYEESLHGDVVSTAFRSIGGRLANGNIGRTQQADFPNTVLLAGGLPIVINDETVGGVGVAGLPGPAVRTVGASGHRRGAELVLGFNKVLILRGESFSVCHFWEGVSSIGRIIPV